jgi:hypothetical protein
MRIQDRIKRILREETQRMLLEASKKKILMDKLGLNEKNAKILDELAGPLSVWLANKFIDYYLREYGKFTKELSPDELKKVTIKKINDADSIYQARQNIVNIMDWVRVGLNGNLGDNKNLSIDGLLRKSKEWHDSLDFGSGDINYVENNPIILDFRDENGDGFYWVDLQTNNSSEECNRMGHCGRSSYGTLYSLREVKTLNPKYRINKSHITASIGGDGILYQMKGVKNSKPKDEYHKYVLPLFYVLGGGGEEEDYLIQGFGTEYASERDFKLSDLGNDVITDLYRNRPELFNTRGLQRKLVELGLIEKPDIDYNIKLKLWTEDVGNYVNGDYVISRRKVKKRTPAGTEYDATIETRLFETILSGDAWELWDSDYSDWKAIVEFNLNKSNSEKIREIIKNLVKDDNVNIDEMDIEELIEEYDDDWEIRRALTNPYSNMESDEYINYLYDTLKKCLEEYGSVEKMDDTGVILNVNVEPFIQDIDDEVLDDRLENCVSNRNEEYECLFKELVGDEYIERPKFRINDYWTPDVDYNEFNELASDYLDEAARIYDKDNK